MKQIIFSTAIILLVSMLIYATSLKNGFVFDDEITIVNNTLVKDLNNLPLLIDKKAYFQRSGEASYRPVVTFTYFMDYALYGIQPWGYHLTNLVLHAANGMLLYIFLTLLLVGHTQPDSPPFCPSPVYREGKSRTPEWRSNNFFSSNIPLIFAILFISHPVLSETVNSISYREDLLAFFFYFASLNIYLFIRSGRKHTLAVNLAVVVSCLFYFLALLSKEMAITLPLIIICYEWIYMGKIRMGKVFSRYVFAFVSVSLLYVYMRFVYFNNPIADGFYTGLVERIYTLPVRLLMFIKLVVFPVSLSADYNLFSEVELPAILMVLSLAALVSVFFIVFKTAKRLDAEEPVFGFLFFLISLIPVLNIIPIYNPVAERYLYLPAVGFTVVLGGCINRMTFFKRSSYRLYIVSILILLCYLPVTQKRIYVWRDDYSLWTDAVRKAPINPRAHYNLGLAYHRRGRIEEAKHEYLLAIKLGHYWEAHDSLGKIYYDQGRIAEAMTELKTAIKLNPGYAIAHYNLGRIYAKVGLTEMAVKEYRIVIRLKPDYVAAHNNLGMAYANQGRIDEAIREFKIAIELDPDSDIARANLAVAYSELDYKKEP